MTTSREIVPTLCPRSRTLTRERLARVLAAACLLALLLAGLWTLVPPPAHGEDAPPGEFSAARAMNHIRAAFHEPHPMGSPQHAATEAYLLRELRALGLRPEVQAVPSLASLQPPGEPPDMVVAANVRNLVARLPGTDSTGAILLAVHYDSMPTTPAAADGGSGTAAALETLRALRAGPPLRNDVILLFFDADTNGLLGSGAFRHEHPWRRDVRLVLSFEGAGTGGPSALMYAEPGYGFLVQEALSILPRPTGLLFLNPLGGMFGPDAWNIATSLGVPALGFLHFAHLERYHTRLDDPAHLDPRSLGHHGENMLALVRHFGNVPLENLGGPDRAAFALTRGTTVTYPLAWALPLAAVPALLFVVALVVGVRRGLIRGRGLLVGSSAALGGALLAAGLAALTLAALFRFNPSYAAFMQGFYGQTWLLLALVTLTGAVLSVLYTARGWRRDPNGVRHALAGLTLWWVLLAVSTGAALPYLSYLFTWPALGGTLALFVLLARPTPARQAGALVLAAAAPLLLLPAVVFMLWMFTLRFVPVGGAVPLAGLTAFVAALGLATLLAPLLPHRTRGRRALPVALFGLAAVLVGVAVSASGNSPAQPRPNHLAYVLDADAGQARWVSAGTRLDPWTAQFFPNGATRATFAASPGYFPDRAFPALQGPAPSLPLAAPTLTMTRDEVGPDGSRVLSLRAASGRGAPTLLLHVQAGGEITAATLDGRPVDLSGRPPQLRSRLRVLHFAVPPAGVELRLVVRGNGPVRMNVTDDSNGLPAIPGLPPRPADTMPALYDFADPTVVTRAFRF